MAEWRVLLDENIDPKVATYLDKEDLFAVHVRDTVGQGADDEDDVLLRPRTRPHYRHE
jgi:predicted nuclease of predicted toxin-antitoxin system